MNLLYRAIYKNIGTWFVTPSSMRVTIPISDLTGMMLLEMVFINLDFEGFYFTDPLSKP